jgi:hypothetical protein
VRLKEFDQAMNRVARLHEAAETLRQEAIDLENETLSLAGIVNADREAGFPCWTHEMTDHYFDTPRQVIEDLERKFGS